MKAVLHTGESLSWAAPLGLPWPVLPVGNRPWLEYWIEWCLEQNIRDIHIVLGEGAYETERCFGDGARSGVTISYSFLKNSADPDSFLRRDPARWRDGIFYLRRPCFPRRPGATTTPLSQNFSAHAGDDTVCLFSTDGATLDDFLAGRKINAPDFPAGQIEPHTIDSLRDYFDLNMQMVHGDIARYVTPGYARQDNAYLGFNVIYPSSCELKPPLIIGNDCRIRALASVGPNVVLGSRIIVDRQAEIRNSLVLDGTYLGAGIEIDGRIIAGRRLIDPQDGTVLELDDAHLLAPLRAVGDRRGAPRQILHYLLAVVLFSVLVWPWFIALLLGLIAGSSYRPRHILGRKGAVKYEVWMTRRETPGWLHRFALDIVPQLIYVLSGHLWLCGQLPCRVGEEDEMKKWSEYFPGVFTYADARPDRDDPLTRRMEAEYYIRHRGIREDLRLLWHAIGGRLAGRTLKTNDE